MPLTNSLSQVAVVIMMSALVYRLQGYQCTRRWLDHGSLAGYRSQFITCLDPIGLDLSLIARVWRLHQFMTLLFVPAVSEK